MDKIFDWLVVRITHIPIPVIDIMYPLELFIHTNCDSMLSLNSKQIILKYSHGHDFSGIIESRIK